MSIAIVYHLYKNSKTIEESLQSLLNQTDHDFELMLVNDGATRTVTQELKKFDLAKFKHVTYYKWNQNVGHSLSFNKAIQDTQATHIHYSGSNVIFDKNFVKNMNAVITKHKPDVISFNKVKNDGSVQIFTKNTLKMNLMLLPSMKDKIFKTSLLKDNNIYLDETAYLPLVFIYKILNAYKKWIIFDGVIAEFHQIKFYTYNLYDIFEQNDYLINNYRETKFWKSISDFIEFCMIIYIIDIFIPRIFNTYTDKSIRKQAIYKSQAWLDKNIPQWRKNKIMNSNKNTNPGLFNKFKKVKFSLFFFAKFIKQNKK